MADLGKGLEMTPAKVARISQLWTARLVTIHTPSKWKDVMNKEKLLANGICTARQLTKQSARQGLTKKTKH